MKKKENYYRLIYKKPGEKVRVLFESDSRKEVEKKRLEFSYRYNTDFLKIEDRREDSENVVIASLAVISVFISLILKYLEAKRNE